MQGCKHGLARQLDCLRSVCGNIQTLCCFGSQCRKVRPARRAQCSSGRDGRRACLWHGHGAIEDNLGRGQLALLGAAIECLAYGFQSLVRKALDHSKLVYVARFAGHEICCLVKLR